MATTGCWLMHSLPYIRISADPLCLIFFLSFIVCGSVCPSRVRPSVLHAFAPVLITFSTWFAFDLAAAYQCRLLLTALQVVGLIGIPSDPHNAVHHNDCYHYCCYYYYYCL